MKENQRPEENPDDFFVVGIGASAGGLDAIQELFDNLPNDTGMAFVIVQHLSQNFKSLMDELLAKHTKMPINLASNGVILKPNHVYLNPSNSNIICKKGKIEYQEKDKSNPLNLPIDLFFHSLGNDLEHRSIGVILSGTGTDGSRGIATIKEAGGTIIVQDPASAQFDGMPLTAINSNLADYILTPGRIAEELSRIADRPRFIIKTEESEDSISENAFDQIIDIIFKISGINFKQYKPATLIRRIEKRMTIRQLTNLKDYLSYLKNDRMEQDLLSNDFLVGVTAFFRDPLAFMELKTKVFPEIFIPHKQKETIRFWVVACSSGEEAYSLAILIDEYLTENKLHFDFKIFATDVDPRAIQTAGAGRYSVNLVADISKERLEKYFLKTGTSLEIVKSLREKIVFSCHNILRDPPFIRMDFISCRNMLIYMKAKIQRKITQTFQFGLKMQGFLFLGNSENLGDVQSQFKTIDAKWRIYKNISEVKILPSQFQNENRLISYNLTNPSYREIGYGIQPKILPETVFNRHIAEELAPICIFIDKNFNILFINGDANIFLQFGRGFLQPDLLKMLADNKLVAIVRNGVRRLKEEKKPIIFKGICFEHEKKSYAADIQFQMAKVETFVEELILLVFTMTTEPTTNAVVYTQEKQDEFSKQRLEDLEGELKSAKQETQNVVEELETSNEELQASNEELQASNEELQSTNEELQSVNEELYTVNSELQAKNKELYELSNDFVNLFNSTNLAMLFLDRQLRIRKFTPELKKIFKLEDNDVNRPIENFASNFVNISGKDLARDVRHVMETSQPSSKQLIDEDGNIFLKKITPFRINDSKVDGALVTFIDINELTSARHQVEVKEEKLRQLFESMVEGFALHEIVCDETGKPVDYIFLDVNPAFEALTQLKKENIIGRKVTEVLPGIENENFDWIGKYGKVALTGITDTFENYTAALDKWYSTKVFSPEKGKFAVIFSDVSERKKFESAIHSSEEKFRTLFETMAQGVVYQNENGEIISANKAAERILGLTFDQMTGRTSADSRWKAIKEDGSPFPGDEHPGMISLKTGEEIKNVVMGIFHPDKEEYNWININSKPLFRANEQKPYQVYATFEDITFQKNALSTLNLTKRNLELALNIAKMGNWEINLKTGKTFWSEQFYQLCGIVPFSLNPSEDLLFNIIHPDDREKTKLAIEQALKENFRYSLNARIVMPNGSTKTILSKGEVLKDKMGLPEKFIGIFIDITDQVKKEAEINKLYKAFLQSPTPNVLTDKNGVIEFVNEALCELTGYSAEELRGHKTNIFKSGKHTPEFYKKLWHDINTHKVWQGEMINKKKDGQLYWEYATISPIFDIDGKLVNYIKVAQDVTDQVEIKEKLELAKKKAEEADNLKSSFLANMSHEIRTPMNSILGFAQILNDPDITNEKRKDYIDVINSQGEHLLTLINDIIDISKVETNSLALRDEICNIKDLIYELQTNFSKNRINPVDIHVQISPDIANPVITIDATRLKQVLTNLIGNAVKFTTHGFVEFGYSLAQSQMIEFYVKDTGVGISPSKHAQIFDRFYQVDTQNKEVLNRGTGLGLAISKALVNLMGGTIWVESEEFVGSTFHFTIPFKQAAQTAAPIKIPPTNYRNIFHGKTILVAEDIESNYMFLKFALNVTGVNIIWVKNGLDAIEEYKNNTAIDLILMDINMPILDGYEATRKIKQLNPLIPIIAQTAYAMESDKKKVMDAGCDDYLSKPLKIACLIDTINKFLNKNSVSEPPLVNKQTN